MYLCSSHRSMFQYCNQTLDSDVIYIQPVEHAQLAKNIPFITATLDAFDSVNSDQGLEFCKQLSHCTLGVLSAPSRPTTPAVRFQVTGVRYSAKRSSTDAIKWQGSKINAPPVEVEAPDLRMSLPNEGGVQACVVQPVVAQNVQVQGYIRIRPHAGAATVGGRPVGQQEREESFSFWKPLLACNECSGCLPLRYWLSTAEA